MGTHYKSLRRVTHHGYGLEIVAEGYTSWVRIINRCGGVHIMGTHYKSLQRVTHHGYAL